MYQLTGSSCGDCCPVTHERGYITLRVRWGQGGRVKRRPARVEHGVLTPLLHTRARSRSRSTVSYSDRNRPFSSIGRDGVLPRYGTVVEEDGGYG